MSKVTSRLFQYTDLDHFDPLDGTPDHLIDLVKEGDTWSILSRGEVVCIWGSIQIWEDRAEIWALMGNKSKHCMLGILRHAKAVMECLPQKRLEACIRCDFEAGLRFIKMLGFGADGYMQSFFPDGGDAYMFSLIHEEAAA